MSLRRASCLACLFIAAAAAGCGSSSRPESVSGSAACALRVDYRGHTYIGNHAGVAPVEVEPLGRGTLPACNDTGGSTAPDPAEEIELAEIEDVPPSVALAWRGRGDVVLIREDVDLDRLGPSLARLLEAPSCDPGDEPIALAGSWLGILGADGATELDLVPPYDVRIHVDESSAKRYERADLTVRVPAGLGRPLSRADVESSLWEGGTLSLTVTCRDGGFTAEHVAARPPA